MALDPVWARAALDPPRAHGTPVARARLRAQPEDFLVEEELGFTPAGVGQHVLLKVRKRNANTQWVARELARIGRFNALDVGFAGLKDRRAVTVQWFSVPGSPGGLDAWLTVKGADFEVLEAHAHSRKLPRGALAGNRFVLRARGVEADVDQLAARVAQVRRYGVPNYFGPQRFGREGANLTAIQRGAQADGRGDDGAGVLAGACAALRKLRQPQRGFVLSAARSLLFNAVLAERVREATWHRLESGDLANLDGRGSIFTVTELDEALRLRCEVLEIHPTGPLWGRGPPPSGGRVFELERRIAEELALVSSLSEAAEMEQERRSLRLAVPDLEWTHEGADVVIRFRLVRGGFATTVLREIFDLAASEEAPDV